MQKHEHFNLYLHDTRALEAELNAKILERTTLHEWPLSCVERLTTARGETWIYKSQFGPTVEPEFYAKARSSLLVPGKTLPGSKKGHSNMLFDYVPTPLLKDCDLSEADVVRIGETLVEEVSSIEGELPYYLDLSTEAKWLALMNELVSSLSTLTLQETYTRVNCETIEVLRGWGHSKEVLKVFAKPMTYVHSDLSGDNIFTDSDSYRVIDWQRPILGPQNLDLVKFFESLDVEPSNYLDKGLIAVKSLLEVHWLTECTLKWFPQGSEVYDRSIANIAKQMGT